MPTFMDKTKEVNRLTFDLVVDVEREWFRPATGKPVRADMVATAPADDLSRLSRDAFVESASQAF